MSEIMINELLEEIEEKNNEVFNTIQLNVENIGEVSVEVYEPYGVSL